MFQLCEHSKVAGVFTKNRYCAAPVQISKKHLDISNDIKALVINTGNANAGTGEAGLKAAQQTCDELSKLLKIDSTGSIQLVNDNLTNKTWKIKFKSM